MQSLFPILLMSALAAPASAWELAICADPAGLPYSSKDESGFDNRIATILAEELGARARFVWMPDRRGKTARGFLHEGACDILMGVIDGQAGTMTSHAYYRSGFVFVFREDGPRVASLDDSALENLRIGLPGGARRTTPPALGLMRRGNMDSLVHFAASGTAGETEARILEALDAGEIDLAVLWGPSVAPLVQARHDLQSVTPEIDMPFLPMFASFAIAVRPEDEALRDALDRALAANWEAVQAVLAETGLPLLPLPKPRLPEAAQ